MGEVEGLLYEDRDFLKQLVCEVVQETLEAEIAELDVHNSMGV